MLPPLVLLITMVLQASPERAPAANVQFRIIVHGSNPVSALSHEEISMIFMRRMRQWPDRTEILPADQSANSPLRERFSRSIHRKSTAYVIRYWHRLIFSGRAIPPPELGSDTAVIDYVKANRGAIGYVSDRASLDGSVKEIVVRR